MTTTERRRDEPRDTVELGPRPRRRPGAPSAWVGERNARARATAASLWRRFRDDVRTRILVWFVALVALAVVASIVLVRQALLTSLELRIDRELRQEVAELRRLAGGVDPATSAPFVDDVGRIFDVYRSRNVPYEHERVFLYVDGVAHDDALGPPSLRPPATARARWAQLTRSERGRVATDAGTLDYLAVPMQQDGRTRGVFVVGIYGDFERAELTQVTWTMSWLGLLAVITASMLAWVGAGRILAPIRALTDTAETITHSDLSRRIEVRGDDDVARLARTFNDMLDRLREAFAAQRRFLDDVGHELRTPITIVRGHLEVLGDDPDERRETIALVIDELERMHRLVSDLTILARAERPDFLDPRIVDLEGLTHDLVRKVEPLGDRRWVVDAAAGATAQLDPQRLTQAVVQLAHNAVDHTVPGDEIGIGSTATRNRAQLWVRDTGAGLPPDDQRRIFERFSGHREGGAGLGLAIVRAIARAHAGTVRADDAPGGGAIFTITVPLRRRRGGGRR